MTQKVVYIAGRGHSGSTILDMALGCHPKMVGLGEVFGVLMGYSDKDGAELPCSCGEMPENCRFWGYFLENGGWYNTVVSYFSRVYGKDTILVDSSKTHTPIEMYLPNYDTKILFLKRNFTGWYNSIHAKYGHNRVKALKSWLTTNIRIQKAIKRTDIPYKCVRYEHLTKQPEAELREICRFIGVEFHPDMLNPSLTKSHIIRGNRVRTEKPTSIKYFKGRNEKV